MTWTEAISFTDKNVPYRYQVSTFIAPGSDLCLVTAEELDVDDKKISTFHFEYNMKLDLASADAAADDKPVQAIINQLLSVQPDMETWK